MPGRTRGPGLPWQPSAATLANARRRPTHCDIRRPRRGEPGRAEPSRGARSLGRERGSARGRDPSVCLFQMQEAGAAQPGFSVLDRLLLTHPVWLQLSLEQDSALYILLREPRGFPRRRARRRGKPLAPTLPPLPPAFALESSALGFPDLCRLVAFYCVSRDVLPFPLQLPDAIANATTRRQLEAISHMGRDFWNSPSASELQNGPPASPSGSPTRAAAAAAAASDRRRLRGRAGRGKLCFVGWPGLELIPVDLAQAAFSVFSVPAAVRIPGPQRLQQETTLQAEHVPPPVRVLRQSVPRGRGVPLPRRPAPSLAELDSNSSFSSLDEESDRDPDSDGEGGPQSPSRGRRRPQRMSEALVCFFAPEKRLARLVQELSRDRRSVFGGMVQDFLSVTSVQLLQGVRLFLSQAKRCLLESGELEPPIETLVPENEREVALERAMFSCVLRPLRAHLDKALVTLHRRDESSRRLSRSLSRLRGEGAAERLGLRAGVPDGRQVGEVKRKLALMRRAHSPVDKLLLLLQVCKCVQKALGAPLGERRPLGTRGWDDFLPSLAYVLVESNWPRIPMEVEYMMELLEPSWLGGEGQRPTERRALDSPLARLDFAARPHATRSSIAKCDLCTTSLTPTLLQRCVRILFQDGERSAVRTLQWRAGESSQALAQLCAATFGVSEPQQYALYWRSGGEMRALPPQAQPQDLAGHSEGGPSLSYLRTDHDFSKMRRLTRGGAVDLSESVCEETGAPLPPEASVRLVEGPHPEKAGPPAPRPPRQSLQLGTFDKETPLARLLFCRILQLQLPRTVGGSTAPPLVSRRTTPVVMAGQMSDRVEWRCFQALVRQLGTRAEQTSPFHTKNTNEH
uniref:Si:ch211-168d1.3 n=1 Tax=Hippocampus comes TaxID=109280 RepID=A0A3Q2XXV3_HIPCM